MRNVTSSLALMAALLLGGAPSNAQHSPAPAKAPAPFQGDIEKLTKQSSDFRRVLFTGAHTQIVAMSLRPGEEIGAEVHNVDQCFFFVDGEGQTVIAGKTSSVEEDDVACVPAGVRHNVRNTGHESLKLYTTYSPPEHPPGTVHHTKAEAEAAEAKEPH
jgi:mannose-6-phosphate isomerase-like protein (cupin superfamily)